MRFISTHEKLVRQVEYMLGIEGTKVEGFGPDVEVYKLMGTGGYVSPRHPNTIFINQHMPYYVQVESVVHEMVHLAQVRWDGLGMDETTGLTKWKGKLIQFDQKWYRAMPWETEAVAKSLYIINELRAKGFFNQRTSSSTLEGVKHERYVANIAKLYRQGLESLLDC
jgi:hypothetical protein